MILILIWYWCTRIAKNESKVDPKSEKDQLIVRDCKHERKSKYNFEWQCLGLINLLSCGDSNKVKLFRSLTAPTQPPPPLPIVHFNSFSSVGPSFHLQQDFVFFEIHKMFAISLIFMCLNLDLVSISPECFSRNFCVVGRHLSYPWNTLFSRPSLRFKYN